MSNINRRRAVAVMVGSLALTGMASAAFAAGVPDALAQRTPKAITGPDSSYAQLVQQQTDVQTQLETQLASAEKALDNAKKNSDAAAAAAARARAAAAASSSNSSSSSSSSSHEPADTGSGEHEDD